MASSAHPLDPIFNNDGTEDLCVPGCGLPLEYWPNDDSGTGGARYRHGNRDFVSPRLVWREICMLHLINAITDKPEWYEKIFNQDITDKWRAEAMEHKMISEATFDWCMRELQDKVKFYKEKAFVVVYDTASACVKSDVLVSSELQAELKAAVQPLLQSPQPDWHPNSNNQVLNLVHPSLYPLVYGRSRALRTGTVGVQDCLRCVGKGEVVVVPPKPTWDAGDAWQRNLREGSPLWSYDFQWLPSEVRFIKETGTEVELTSYINNLHPSQHMPLYHAIEKIISLSIPAWNSVIVDGDQGLVPPRIRTYGVDVLDGDMPEWVEQIHDEPEVTEELRAKVREYMALPSRAGYEVLSVDDDNFDEEEHVPSDWEQLSGWPLWEAIHAKLRQIRQFIHPEPGAAYSYEDWKAGKVDKAVIPPQYSVVLKTHDYYSTSLQDDFRQRGLQVIVKLASIELTPDNATYSGGNWHLEGMLNEHIVATAIYYYDVKNVTQSSLLFRQEAYLEEEGLAYEQDDHGPLSEIFGCTNEGLRDAAAIQEIGRLNTPEGRLIAFPNTLQHRVEPFELEDKSQAGHRRFLVLWLVDPHLRVMSTANVPPQQHDWWAEAARRESNFQLPVEVADMIMQRTDDWPMGLDEAKQLRLQLMAERTTATELVKSSVETYNLCEH